MRCAWSNGPGNPSAPRAPELAVFAAVLAGLADYEFVMAGPVSDQPVPAVRVAAVGRQTRRQQVQRTHGRLAAIDQPVSTGWAFREAHEIAGLELILTLRVGKLGGPARTSNHFSRPYAEW